MMNSPVPSGGLLRRQGDAAEQSWVDFLRSRIVDDWRPGEFYPETLLFRPNPDDRFTMLHRCMRSGCGVHLNRGHLCAICSKEWQRERVRNPGRTREEWAVQPRVRAEHDQRYDCAVKGCRRSHAAKGLCSAHGTSYLANRKLHAGAEYSVDDWIRHRNPRPLPALAKCPWPDCWRDQALDTGLCTIHDRRFKHWVAGQPDGNLQDTGQAVAVWLAREAEPYLDPEIRLTYSAVSATPFDLLPEPLRWEFLHAVQQRDLNNPHKLAAIEVRSTYYALRRLGWTTAVGRMQAARGEFLGNPGLRGLLKEWARAIDDAHRAWSGIDERDPNIIYLRDLPIPPSGKWGPNSRLDLSSIEQGWIRDTVTAWMRGGQRTRHELDRAAWAWRIVDEALRQRGSNRPDELGTDDMDAVLRAVRRRWDATKTQERALLQIERIIEWARLAAEVEDIWRNVPAAFRRDRTRHRGHGRNPKSASNADEPYRFVPQPIVDWVMDHLNLLERGDPYLTAEGRVMLYVHERCGRRPGETSRLLDDCLSYDNEGAPYLEWRMGKPPYAMGKRLPIHQETHDAIQQWREIKRERGITSNWLFPSIRRLRHDPPLSDSTVNDRVRELVAELVQHAPYEAAVEGPDGNLIHFNLAALDAYSFRHAFAQRLADATDADGRSTTPPDVLQEYMGHKNFNTTMAYYEVTAKRRKNALASIAPRRLSMTGSVVGVDRERDTFTKIAVTLGHCGEPQNVLSGGHACMLDHACESCPFFLVDPLERDGMRAKRDSLLVKLERARVIDAPQHLLDHYEARVKDTDVIIDGIDSYIASLPRAERDDITVALERMADIRKRATAARHIDIRHLFARPQEGP